MIIALTSQFGLAVPKGKDHARAAALFPKLARQVEEMGGNIGVDFAYFRTTREARPAGAQRTLNPSTARSISAPVSSISRPSLQRRRWPVR